ncbi:peptidylprolyl isomerase [Thiococcus pfennigii]|jgi:peptidyl-prolyl cis-trans isomerase C|uniref:peptidylprolyl isomerase n=1 Tax=Thiococcus pfennigii TaxID=1057 RepID=UPI001908CBF8|nr:peptidylprolyl isomerase [Thiococcus pfennigii]MBK1699851.1 peptidylprolyl isomerase [Thiococcus pfennigii]MBK1731637.1 peptidylprolyl isomerase [Thiococcus pfennigii]
MKSFRLAALAGGLCLAIAMQAAPVLAADDGSGDDAVIATINGEAIPLETFQIFYFERMQEERAENTQEFQEQVFNEFINLVIVAQAGKRQGLDARDDVRGTIQLQTMKILSAAAQRAMLEDEPPSDAELKKAYDRFVTGAERTEYKARHILVADEAEAKRLIGQLDKGAKFAELAQQHSLGPTGKNGGDLDWFSADQMVKPFADAVKGLKPGRYNTKPVHTQFGWHVILLEETRKAEPPTFEQAKPQLIATLQRERLREGITDLRKDSVVTLNTDIVKLKDED